VTELMLRKKILKDTLLLNASSIIAQGVGFFQSIFMMKFLDPDTYGLWLGLNIVLLYSAHIHLGMEFGMGVRLPYFNGKGEIERAEQMADTVYVLWTAAVILLAAGVVAFGLFMPGLKEIERFGLFIIAAISLFAQQIQFFTRWLTSAQKDFSVISIMSIVRSVVSFVLTVLFARSYGVQGVIVAAGLTFLIMFPLWFFKTPYRFRWKLSKEMFFDSIQTGFPIFLVVLGGVLIQTLDRSLILMLLGPKSLGTYGIVTLASGVSYGLMAQAGSAISPHIAEEMGRSKDDPTALAKFLVKPTLMFSSFAAVLGMSLFIAVPPLVEFLLPKYRSALPAFICALPAAYFLSIILTASNILNIILITQKRQRLVIYLQGLAILVQVCCTIKFIDLGWSVAGAALGATVSAAAYSIATLALTAAQMSSSRVWQLQFLLDVLIPFACALGVAALSTVIGSHFLKEHAPLALVAQALLVLISAVLLGVWLNKRIKALDEFLPLLRDAGRRLLALWPA
jgi:O-antigen/teichoic acid export membrane protein